MFCRKLDSSGSGSDSIIFSIEDNEARSDRALSSLLTLSRFAERLSDERPVAMVVLVAGRFRTGYPYQRSFLERGIIFREIKNCGSRLYLLLKIVIMKKHLFHV